YRHHRPHRQVDAPRRDDQHHAQSKQRDRRAAAQDVDQADEQTAVLPPQIEELRRDGAVDREDHQQGDDLGKATALQQSLQQALQQSWHHGCPASAPAVPATAIAARILETSMASPSSSSMWLRSRSTTTRSE